MLQHRLCHVKRPMERINQNSIYHTERKDEATKRTTGKLGSHFATKLEIPFRLASDSAPHFQSSCAISFPPLKSLPFPICFFFFFHGGCLGSLRLLRLIVSLCQISISISISTQPLYLFLFLSPNQKSATPISCLEVSREQFGCWWSFQ